MEQLRVDEFLTSKVVKGAVVALQMQNVKFSGLFSKSLELGLGMR